MTDNDETAKLWSFAYATYTMPGVADACLDLQDRFGADVNLLLFSAWAGSLFIRLTANDIDRAEDLVAAWHDEIVNPLRAVRRRLKSGPSPAPDARTEALRSKLKALEIETERFELAQLEAALPTMGVKGEQAADLQMLIQNNLYAMLGKTGAVDDTSGKSIRILAAAAVAIATATTDDSRNDTTGDSI